MHAKVPAMDRAAFEALVNKLEHEPLIAKRTLEIAIAAGLLAGLFGAYLWLSALNPAGLHKTTGTVRESAQAHTSVNGAAAHHAIITFTTSEGREVTFKSSHTTATPYAAGQAVSVGYHPANPNYARNLSAVRPPLVSLLLIAVPPAVLLGLAILAGYRHHERQVRIWEAAEAAGIDEPET